MLSARKATGNDIFQQLMAMCRSELSKLRSKGTKRKTKITFFVGQTDNLFKIYWLDFDGNKRSYTSLSSGMSWTTETYRSHSWAVYKVSPSGGETCNSIVKGKKISTQWLLR